MNRVILAVAAVTLLGGYSRGGESLNIKRVANATNDLVVSCAAGALASTGAWDGGIDNGNDSASEFAVATDSNGAVVYTHATSSATATCVPSVNGAILVPQVSISGMSTAEVSGTGAWLGDQAQYITSAGAQVNLQVQPPTLSSATTAVLAAQIHITASSLNTGFSPGSGDTFLVEAGSYSVIGVLNGDAVTWDVTVNFQGQEVWRDNTSSGNFILSASETVNVGATRFINAGFNQNAALPGPGTSNTNWSTVVAFYAEAIEGDAPEPTVDLFYPETEEGRKLWTRPPEE